MAPACMKTISLVNGATGGPGRVARRGSRLCARSPELSGLQLLVVRVTKSFRISGTDVGDKVGMPEVSYHS